MPCQDGRSLARRPRPRRRPAHRQQGVFAGVVGSFPAPARARGGRSPRTLGEDQMRPIHPTAPIHRTAQSGDDAHCLDGPCHGSDDTHHAHGPFHSRHPMKLRPKVRAITNGWTAQSRYDTQDLHRPLQARNPFTLRPKVRTPSMSDTAQTTNGTHSGGGYRKENRWNWN
jgi:hypothetical protein